MCDFVHLHSHTQFSLLDGAAGISKMLKKAKENNMPAAAITDHGNMFGVFNFFNEAQKVGIKPILGCEVYITDDIFKKSFVGGEKDKRYHQLLLAKNAIGYRNLTKLVSIGFVDGYYRTFPRVDRDLIKKYKEGVIATTCCIGAEVPQAIIHLGVEAAEKIFLEWLDIFEDDYYVELQRHHIDDIDGTGVSQEYVNQVLLGFAKKHNVKVIATNDSHYVEERDWEAHDILLCLQTNSDIDSENRFKFHNNQFYFKTQEEMKSLFHDVPQAIENTLHIAEKVESLNLKRDILLPSFVLPAGFDSQDDYLRHITLEGAKKRYYELTTEVIERINLELNIIKDMKFPGYFLIVQDFISEAKNMGVSVGPGRGSAAGSIVAYCIGITNIDPIKYNLLFERFLNPERVSMPDIDIDFDDVNRQKVIDYVVDKYGKNQVAQVITYGTMGAKTAIRDVGRVLKLPLSETDKIAKMVPESPGTTFKSAYEESPELNNIRNNTEGSARKVLEMAEILEGSVRHRGIHAAAVIIAPGNLTDFIPVCTSKDAQLLVTQFDGKSIEEAGMLKMDFLGLKTLTIIDDAIKLIEQRRGIKIIPDDIPLDDEATIQLYQRGDTIGTFQFESDGMRTYLKDLKPTNIEDLIAMNALYRPGPMDYIPEFIARKKGKKKIEYPHPLLENLLKPTYGIMVYQEQIMQTAQILAGYKLGEADILRRAMGKKKKEEMDKQKAIFISGAKNTNNIEPEKAEEVFNIMEKFASYGFNRSHAAAYSVLAFQTAYLKANYPSEYMAAVLSNNMNDTKKVNFFLKEARRMGISTLVPDINESDVKFSVNKNGDIRFALSALKGVGEAAVSHLVEERTLNGNYTSLFDLIKRINLRIVNKKSLEALAQSGAFDSFEKGNRAQYIENDSSETNMIEKAIKFGNQYKSETKEQTLSLFGDAALEKQLIEPKMPDIEEWPNEIKLKREKEVTGIYISGHPLDEFELEIEKFTNCSLTEIEEKKETRIKIGAIVSGYSQRMDKNGRPFAQVTLEDFEDSYQFMLFKDDFIKYSKYFENIGSKLLVIAEYKPQYYNKDKFEFKIIDVQFLVDVMEKGTKGIAFSIPYDFIDSEIIDKIDYIITKNKGKKNLEIHLTSTVMNNKIVLFSRSRMIDINKATIELFKEIPNSKTDILLKSN